VGLVGETGLRGKAGKIGASSERCELEQALEAQYPLQCLESIAEGVHAAAPKSSLTDPDATAQLLEPARSRIMVICQGVRAQTGNLLVRGAHVWQASEQRPLQACQDRTGMKCSEGAGALRTSERGTPSH
jgi:hypothetical protein